MAYKTGIDRSEVNFYPGSLEEGISLDNVVRVIDAFVDWLDMAKLGFIHATDNVRGTSVYPPSMLLKLYLYGYLNRIRSSRRLETECRRNIELYWLLHRMTPAYHTIADFRKNNAVAIKETFKSFTQFCITASLIEGETVAFDGTKIRAQNNVKNNFNAARLEKLLERIDLKTKEYEQYLHNLDEQDKKEGQRPSLIPAVGRTKEEIGRALAILKEREAKYKGFQSQLEQIEAEGGSTEQLQISTTDPDARSLPFKQRHTEIGYNIQTAVDAKHKLIVHFEVTNVGDNNALAVLTADTKTALNLGEQDRLNALADTGYHTGHQLAKCAENGIITFVSPPEIKVTKTSEQPQTFAKDQFIYDSQTDSYTCPNKQKLTTTGTLYEHVSTQKRSAPRKYKQYTLPSKVCQECPFAAKCQGSRKKYWHGKTIERNEYEDAVEANRKRVEQNKGVYQQRKEIIEHPFGTIKRSWGYYYTLLKTKKKIAAEFALIFLCYNLRRVISIFGVNELREILGFYFLIFSEALKAVVTLFYQKNMKNINFIIR